MIGHDKGALVRIAVILLGVTLCFACGKPSSASIDKSDPLAVADAVLDAYRAGDWARLASHTRSIEHDREPELARVIERGFTGWRRRSIELWDGAAPTEVRYAYYNAPRNQSTEAIVRFADLGHDEIAAVRLVRERGVWRFAKLISPTRQHFESEARSIEEAMKVHELRWGAAKRQPPPRVRR